MQQFICFTHRKTVVGHSYWISVDDLFAELADKLVIVIYKTATSLAFLNFPIHAHYAF